MSTPYFWQLILVFCALNPQPLNPLRARKRGKAVRPCPNVICLTWHYLIILSALHFLDALQDRVDHIIHLLLAEAIDGQMREAAVESLLAYRTSSRDGILVVAKGLQNVKTIQRPEMRDVGDPLFSQLRFERLDISARLCRVNLQLIEVERRLNILAAEILRQYGRDCANCFGKDGIMKKLLYIPLAIAPSESIP